jgi:hypothetical protein
MTDVIMPNVTLGRALLVLPLPLKEPEEDFDKLLVPDDDEPFETEEVSELCVPVEVEFLEIGREADEEDDFDKVLLPDEDELFEIEELIELPVEDEAEEEDCFDKLLVPDDDELFETEEVPMLLEVEFLETGKETEDEDDFGKLIVSDDDELFEIKVVEFCVLLEEDTEAPVPINEELDDLERLPVVERPGPLEDVFVLLLELSGIIILEDVV